MSRNTLKFLEIVNLVAMIVLMILFRNLEVLFFLVLFVAIVISIVLSYQLRCPHCGRWPNKGEGYCPRCGEKLDD